MYRTRQARPCTVAALRMHVEKKSHVEIHLLKRRGSTVANPVRLDLHASLIRSAPASGMRHVTAGTPRMPLQTVL